MPNEGLAFKIGFDPAAVEHGSAAVKESLQKVRESGMLLKESFRGLSESAMLLGGERMEGLFRGAMLAREGLMATRTAAMLTGLSLAAVAPIAAGLAAALGVGLIAWQNYRKELAANEEAVKRYADAYKTLPALIKSLRELGSSGIISQEQAMRHLQAVGALGIVDTSKVSFEPSAAPTPRPRSPYAQRSFIGGGEGSLSMEPTAAGKPDNALAAQLAGFKRGDAVQQIEDAKKALEGMVTPEGELTAGVQSEIKFREEAKKMVAEEGYAWQKTKLEAEDYYTTLVADLKTYAALSDGRVTKEQLDAQLALAAQQRDVKIAEGLYKSAEEQHSKDAEEFSRRREETAARVAKAQEILERGLTIKALEEGTQRQRDYEAEYQQRTALYKKQFDAAEISEAEHTKLVEEAEQKRLEDRKQAASSAIAIERLERENAMARLRLQEELIKADPYKTEAEKAALLLPILKQVTAEYQKQLDAIRQQLQAQGLDPHQRGQLQLQQTQLSGQMAMTQQQGQNLSQQGTFGAGMQAWGKQAQGQVEDFGKTAAETIQGTIGKAVDVVSEQFTKLIEHTTTWKKALAEIGGTIMNQIISSIVKMFVQLIVNSIAYHALQKLFSTEQKADLAITAAAALPAAATVSVASYGTAAIVGEIALAAALAAAAGLLASGGFEKGGYTGPGGRSQVAGVVHGNEYVVPSDVVGREGLTNLEALRSGGATITPNSRASGASPEIHVHVWNDQMEAMKNHIKNNPEVQHVVVDAVRKNYHTMGRTDGRG